MLCYNVTLKDFWRQDRWSKGPLAAVNFGSQPFQSSEQEKFSGLSKRDRGLLRTEKLDKKNYIKNQYINYR